MVVRRLSGRYLKSLVLLSFRLRTTDFLFLPIRCSKYKCRENFQPGASAVDMTFYSVKG